jgi:LysM repeat protein
LDDKLHFNSKGYSLQGKIFSHAFLKEYYRLFDIENADLENLENELQAMMQPIFTEKKKLVLGNENIDMSRNTVESKNQPKSTVYTIKSGDTLSVIAKRHNSSVHKILKANKLNEKSVIYPNQQIIIPAD